MSGFPVAVFSVDKCEALDRQTTAAAAAFAASPTTVSIARLMLQEGDEDAFAFRKN